MVSTYKSIPEEKNKVTYHFIFDPIRELKFIKNKNLRPDFKSIALGYYDVANNELYNYPNLTTNYLPKYQNDMYNKRIKKSFIKNRYDFLLELGWLECENLCVTDEDKPDREQITITEKEVRIKPIFSLHNIGVGALSLWLEINETINLEKILYLRNIDSLRAKIDNYRNDRELEGYLTSRNMIRITDVAKLLILRLLCLIFDICNFKDIIKKLSSNDIDEIFNSTQIKLLNNKSTFYMDIENYPIFHLYLPDISASMMTSYWKDNSKILRAIITGDKNWQHKKDEIIEKLFEYNVSTRDSIIWITHPEGTLKIYSKDIETPLLTSQILVAYELELVLVLKYFLYKIINQINFSFKDPIRLSLLRDLVTKQLDEYYGIDISGKDTTRNRIEKFKNYLHINYLINVKDRQFDSLNSALSTAYQQYLVKRQEFQSWIIGIFGFLSMSIILLFKLVDLRYIPNRPVLYSLVILGIVFFVVIFYFIYKKIQLKKISR